MKVLVLYFAAVADLLERDREALSLPDEVRTLEDFAGHLTRLHPPLAPWLPSVRLARNEAFVDGSTLLADGDVLAVIPPVAGG